MLPSNSKGPYQNMSVTYSIVYIGCIEGGTHHSEQVSVDNFPSSVALSLPRVLVLRFVDEYLAAVDRVRDTSVRDEEMRSLEVGDGHSGGQAADVDVLGSHKVLGGCEVQQTGLQGVDDVLKTDHYADGVRVVGTGVFCEDFGKGSPVATVDGEGVEGNDLTDCFNGGGVGEHRSGEE